MSNEKGEKKGGGIVNINELLKNKMVILIAVVVLIVILLGVMIASIISKNTKKTEITVTKGVLTCAIGLSDDRYAYHDENGNLAGIEPELATRLAQAEGLQLKIVETENAKEALSLLDTKACDVAFARISSDQNLNGYAVSSDYGRCGLFLVTAIHDYTNSLNLMTGYSVGIMDNIKVTAQTLDNYDYISPKDYSSTVTLGEDIRDRVINMGILSERDATMLVKNYPNALQMQEIVDGPMEYYVAVFPQNESVHAQVLNGVINSPADESATTEENTNTNETNAEASGSDEGATN